MTHPSPEELRELVEEARAMQAQFLEYERSHLGKGTPESNEKAKVNRQWAVRAGCLADALTVSEATIKSLLALVEDKNRRLDALSQPPSEAELERMARAVHAARFAHPDHPAREPTEPDEDDMEYATRLVRAALSSKEP